MKESQGVKESKGMSWELGYKEEPWYELGAGV